VTNAMNPKGHEPQAYPLEKLEREVSSIRIDEEQGLIEFLPLAARLAALGRKGPLDRGCDAGRRFPGFAALLADRCREGAWELREALGEDLGMAVVAAQDFHCLSRLAGPGVIPAEAAPHLEAWFDDAESTPLDAEAVEVLERFLQRFPIPEELRLAVVDSPATEFEDHLLANAAAGRLAHAAPATVRWKSDRFRAEALAADAGKVTDATRESYEILDDALDLPGVGTAKLSRRVDRNDDVVLDIQVEGKPEIRAESVSLGGRPATRGSSSLPEARFPGWSCWIVPLRGLDLQARLEALREPFLIAFSDGTRVKVV
jgi:hypothetical protein